MPSWQKSLKWTKPTSPPTPTSRKLDSLSLVDLVAVIQQTYKIKIPVAELKTIQTFDNLYDYILFHAAQA